MFRVWTKPKKNSIHIWGITKRHKTIMHKSTYRIDMISIFVTIAYNGELL